MYVWNIYAFDKDQLCAWTTIRKKCESIPIYTDAYVLDIYTDEKSVDHLIDCEIGLCA